MRPVGMPVAGLLAVLVALSPVSPVEAEVFHAKDEALVLAFPDTTTTVESKTVFLTEAQVDTVRTRAGVELDSRLFTYYVGRHAGAVVGYAVIDTHIVRSLPETFLVVLTPDGTVSQLVLLAFYEPREYMPSTRWLAQFRERDLDSAGWRLGRDIHGISGATLTARAVPQALRKILALYELVMRPPRF